MSHRVTRIVGVWTLVVAVCAAQEFSGAHWGGGPLTWGPILLIQSATWAVWVALAYVFVPLLYRRFPVSGARAAPHGAVHVGAACALALIAGGAAAVVAGLFYFGVTPLAMWDMFRDRVHTGLAGVGLAYGGIVAVLHARPQQGGADAGRTSAGDGQSAPVGRAAPLQRLLVKEKGRLVVIRSAEVDWLEADDDTVRLHVGQTVHTLRDTLTALGERLDPRRFARIHRSTMVNLDRVREVQPWFRGEEILLLTDDTRLRIGPNYRQGFLEQLRGGH